MNPPDVRQCTLRELHQFLTDWVKEHDTGSDFDEWEDD